MCFRDSAGSTSEQGVILSPDPQFGMQQKLSLRILFRLIILYCHG